MRQDGTHPCRQQPKPQSSRGAPRVSCGAPTASMRRPRRARRPCSGRSRAPPRPCRETSRRRPRRPAAVRGRAGRHRPARPRTDSASAACALGATSTPDIIPGERHEALCAVNAQTAHSDVGDVLLGVRHGGSLPAVAPCRMPPATVRSTSAWPEPAGVSAARRFCYCLVPRCGIIQRQDTRLWTVEPRFESSSRSQLSLAAGPNPVGASSVARSSRGLGRRPLTPVTRVRIPHALPAPSLPAVAAPKRPLGAALLTTLQLPEAF